MRSMRRHPVSILGVIVAALATTAATAHASGSPHQRLTDYLWVSLTTTNGLFPGPFRAIAQDKDGYLWLGVSGDLIRFDGTDFVDGESLGHGTWQNKGVITTLCGARDGSLWVGRSTGGVSRMIKGRFVNYGPESGVPSGSITSILEDSRGAIWIASRNGLSRFVSEHWEARSGWPGVTPESADTLFEDRAGNFWVDNSKGLFIRRSQQDHFEQLRAAEVPVQSFAEDRDGSLWVTGRSVGLERLHADGSTTPISGTASGVNGIRILGDRAGNVWVGTRGQGLFRVSMGEDGVVQHLGKDDGLMSDVVLALFEDREGNIWVGTENSLVRVTEAKGIVTDTPGMSSAHQVTTTADGSVWVGTTDGVFRFQPTGRTQYTERNGLPSNTITALVANTGDALWVGTEHGLARFVDGGFQRVTLPGGLRPNAVSSLTFDPKQTLWFCDSELGLFRLSKDGALDSPMPNAQRKRCPSAYVDREGRVWFGFSDGTLSVFANDTSHTYSDQDGLTGGIVTAIYEDQQGTIWIGTNKGLSRFHGGSFQSFTQANGLPAKAVSGILGDNTGHLWFSLITGIIRVEPAEFDKAAADPKYAILYRSYDVSDGLVGPPLYLGSPNAIQARDGRLWLVTTGGVASVDPQQIRETDPAPPTRITTITADDQTIEADGDVRLSPNLNELTVNYTALNFRSALKARFRYKLEGFDADWVDAGPRRQAIYTHLPPGQYRFRVSARTVGAAWNASTSDLDFSVAPTFYQTSWFRGGLVLLFALTLAVAWTRRLTGVKRKYALIFEERSRIAREIHDTLLQSLLGVALQFDVIAQKMELSPESAREHLWRTREDVENYIREARQSIWDMRSPTLQARDLPTALRSACDSIAAGHGVRCELVIDGSPKRYPVKIEEHLMRIGQEAVVNAVRHASPTEIHVMLSYSPGSLLLSVTDNGGGFDQNHIRADSEGHWGLSDMKERSKEIGATFTLLTSPGQGTRVEALVPYAAKG